MSRHFGVGVVIFLAGSWAVAQNAKDKTPDYYPIQLGNEWHYSASANGQTSKLVTRIAKVEDFDGQKLSRLERPDIKFTEHLLQNEKGVFRARVNGAAVTPPVQLIVYPAKPGTKWKGAFTSQGKEGNYAGEILKEETIKVPAGEFKTICVQIKLQQNGQEINTTYWFAPDVGFVKETVDSAGSSFSLELEKFERMK